MQAWQVEKMLREEARNTKNSLPQKAFNPSIFQQGVFDAMQFKKGNFMVKAVAGSGKSTTIKHAFKYAPGRAIYIAYNKHIVVDFEGAAENVEVKTLHSFGKSVIDSNLPRRPDVDPDKTYNLIKELYPDLPRELYTPLCHLISLAKNTLADVGQRSVYDELVFHYNVELDAPGADRCFTMLPKLLAESNRRVTVIDFDDMIYLPIVLNLPVRQYQWVFVDESQDMNSCQIELILRMIANDGRCVAVGDENQSIYGFRSADPAAMQKMQERLDATLLPLSITYRCPKSHVELAKQFVSDIQAAENAIEGTIETVKYNTMLTGVTDGDLILCRTNAPLVKTAYELLALGRKVVIRGRDIGKNIQALIDRLKPTDLDDLYKKLEEYQDREVSRLVRIHKEPQAQGIKEKVETVYALMSGMSNLSELREKVNSIFNDESKVGIILSSVHRAKGDEADNVWILRPDLLPHPMAKQDWEQAQERNLQYVAFTRSKKALYFVGKE